ncbi:MAG: Ferredoxin-type protein NapG [Burkholderia sp.]|jgi:ferredoxin-type protein NapG
MSSADEKLSRRKLFKSAVELSAAGAVVAFAWGNVSMRDAHAHWVPRPPGALPGKKFLAACSRCGQCVTACPYDALVLAGPFSPAPAGTPYFEPRKIPCYMCPELYCVKACPTGALDPELKDIADARMGVAVIDPSSCLSMQGLRCEVCYRDCPEQGKAITLELHPRSISKHAMFIPTIHPDKCTGCGLCMKGCPTDVPAINIADREQVLGKIGEHYRLGWLDPNDPKNKRDETPDPKIDESRPGGLDFLNEHAL